MKTAPALAMLELKSLARGLLTGDAIVKKAEVRLHTAEAVSDGKYILIFSGEVAPVEESFQAGVDIAGEYLVDKVILPQVHPQLINYLREDYPQYTIDSLGTIETSSVATIIHVADAVCKTAPVDIVELKLAKGIGGKGFLLFTGYLPDVEAALENGTTIAQKFGRLTRREIIQSPHKEFSDLIRSGGSIALR